MCDLLFDYYYIKPSTESDDDEDGDLHNEDSLLLQVSNEKAKQREQLAYEQLASCGMFLSVELLPFSHQIFKFKCIYILQFFSIVFKFFFMKINLLIWNIMP